MASILTVEEYAKLSLPPDPDGFLLGLFFDHVNGIDMLVRNVWLSTNYTALQTIRPYSL
jgi:hypothetical protein